jgi:hypothetical protein
VAKVIKAAQIAMTWNLKREFATPDFRPGNTAGVLSESTQYIGSRTPKMPKV